MVLKLNPPPLDLPSAEIIQAKLKQLNVASATLNTLSDQLTKEVHAIEGVINRLNLGITAYVAFETRVDETGLIGDDWRIGYGRTAGRWGLVVQRRSWNENIGPDADDEEVWAFKDSPREKRVLAVEKIPALLDVLVNKSSAFAEQITERVSYTKGLVAGFIPAKPENAGK